MLKKGDYEREQKIRKELQAKFDESLQEANRQQQETMSAWLGVEVKKTRKNLQEDFAHQLQEMRNNISAEYEAKLELERLKLLVRNPSSATGLSHMSQGRPGKRSCQE
jgi:hypothetical protein